MRGLERLTHFRLAEIAGRQSGASLETVQYALAECETGETLLSEALVRVNVCSEWDLMRLVSMEFGLPILRASQYDIQKDLLKATSRELLFRTLLVPLDRFSGVVTVAMPVFSPVEILDQAAKLFSCEIFPVVGSFTDNRRLLEDKLKAAAPKEAAAEAASADQDWGRLFDLADESVQEQAKQPAPRAVPGPRRIAKPPERAR
jgi:hypothetical protein